MNSRYILGMRVDAVSYASVVESTANWAMHSESRYVCVSTVNNVMEAHDDPGFKRIANGADLVTPDGMPLVWGLRLLGVAGASRVYGPDLTLHVLRAAAEAGIPVGFYGASNEALDALGARIRREYPGLRVVFRVSPPYRTLTEEEEAEVVDWIQRSGCRILFVGLNSPKQDVWMSRHRGKIACVMLGVGAAFDFLSGQKRQAPRWMMRMGLEWLFRLMTEPRRLWKRYLKHNPRFVVYFGWQLLKGRLWGRGQHEAA